ncbi:hypothetical protein ABT337_19845 [Saccharopolyspora hirsuta]|uniref:Uncharacterized protein n=1 Tax=Saccharopolyspora hirsuta TaxID=1837 RepID=A0A5M7C1B0_SACHI|nr:hypothetical protein [Saccharopolyspora hirsuta]KAA5833341.1 hypothetical protein F1721_13625 [Saccharopolyspora hirsuta]
MNRKTLIGITIGWGVLVAAVFAVLLGMAMFSGTSLAKADTADGSTGPYYRWDGEPMLITSTQSNKSAVCKVVPDEGEARDISTYRAEGRRYVDPVTPWFSGGARMSCTTPVKIRVGSEVTSYELFAKNRVVQIGAAVIAAGPFLAVSVFGLGSRKARA